MKHILSILFLLSFLMPHSGVKKCDLSLEHNLRYPRPDLHTYCDSPSGNFRVHYDKRPATLESSNQTNYISVNYPHILLYACLVEAYGYLKGPMDMLTLYEQKYKQEVDKFGVEQIGRRRRDDYTDGAVRITIPSTNP